MKEIMFRVWNKKYGFMDSAWLMDFEHKLICHSRHNQSEMVDCVLMQWTGLKDIEGNLIYDGDIIEGVDPYAKFTGGRFKTNVTAEIVWNKPQMGWRLKGVGSHNKKQASILKLRDKKVIGNIYEGIKMNHTNIKINHDKSIFYEVINKNKRSDNNGKCI